MADGPNIDLIVPRFEEITAFYQAADKMGFHSLWFTETLFSHSTAVGLGGRVSFGGRGGLDPYGALAAAASATSHIRLATALSGSPSSGIAPFAAKMADLDNLSGGRLSLGISQSRWPAERVRDYHRARVGVRLKETITVLKSLWSESEVTFKGSHLRLERASMLNSRAR